MKIFDSHAHLLFPKLKNRLNEVLLNAVQNNIFYIMNIALGPDLQNLYDALNLKNKFDGIGLTAGTHPHDAKNYSEEFTSEIIKFASEISTIGEIGLDYHYDFSPRLKQIEVFEKQIELANQLNKPIVMHIREAHKDAIDILNNFKLKKSAIVHCYTSNSLIAEKYLEMGFYISFSGIITFPNAKETQEAVKIVPNDRYLVETDSPYLAPIPKRGKTCEPAFTLFTLQKLAELKKLTPKEVAQYSTANTFKAFEIRDDFKPLNPKQFII